MLPKLVSRTARKWPFDIERKLGRDAMVAPVTVRKEARRPLIGPFHRPSERARRMQHADIFGKDRRLHAERPADIAGQHVYLFGFDIKHLRDVGAHAEHALRSDMQRKAAVLVAAKRRARLHRD